MCLSTTKELEWNMESNGTTLNAISINAPRTQAAVGFKDRTVVGVSLSDVEIRDVKPLFTATYVTSLDDLPIANSKSMLITTIARARNTDQKLIGGTLINRGTGPILMEPVICELEFRRAGTPTVHVLDHDGRRTGKTLPVENGRVKLDGRETKTVYYEVSYE